MLNASPTLLLFYFCRQYQVQGKIHMWLPQQSWVRGWMAPYGSVNYPVLRLHGQRHTPSERRALLYRGPLTYHTTHWARVGPHTAANITVIHIYSSSVRYVLMVAGLVRPGCRIDVIIVYWKFQLFRFFIDICNYYFFAGAFTSTHITIIFTFFFFFFMQTRWTRFAR